MVAILSGRLARHLSAQFFSPDHGGWERSTRSWLISADSFCLQSKDDIVRLHFYKMIERRIFIEGRGEIERYRGRDRERG